MEKKKNITSFRAVPLSYRNIHKKTKCTSKGEWQTTLMASSSELALFPPLPSPRGERACTCSTERRKSKRDVSER
jgi:hypothetical protein